MAVIALCSASGSPGVTSTCLGLAFSWPRPVLLVEADPTGGSGLLSGWFKGTRDYRGGLVELSLAPDGIANALPHFTQSIEGSNVSFVAGVRSHRQSASLREQWAPLGEALSDLGSAGRDVIIDAGRLGLRNSPEPLLVSADLTLLTTRTNLPALAAARSWAASVADGDLGWPEPGLLVIGSGQPYSAKQVANVLQIPLAATICNDADAAAVYHRGTEPGKRFWTAPYARSLRAAVGAIHARISHRPELEGVVSP